MLGIGWEWWILYVVIFLAAGHVTSSLGGSLMRTKPELTPEQEQRRDEWQDLQRRQREAFMEGVTEQLGSIYQRVPDVSDLELHALDILASLERIEKALGAKCREPVQP